MTFNKSKFIYDADFSNAKFNWNVNFEETKFFGNTNFRKTKFSKEANFKDAKFMGYADFYKTKFLKEAVFFKTSFLEGTCFKQARFFENANYSGANLFVIVDFSYTLFSDIADFSLSNFSGLIFFSNANFLGGGQFLGAIFSGGTYFSGACFTGYADFSLNYFFEDVFFLNTTFKDKINFTSINFLGGVFFIKANFTSSLIPFEFYSNIIQNNLLFNSSHFESGCIFNQITILETEDVVSLLINYDRVSSHGNFEINRTIFNNNSLLSMIGTKIDGNLIFTSNTIDGIANFNNLDVVGDINLKGTNIHNPQSQENIYRKAKTHASELGDKHTSDNFFYLEKVARKENLWKDFKKSLLNFPRPCCSKKCIKVLFSKMHKVGNASSLRKFINNYIKFVSLYLSYLFELPMHYYFYYGVKPLYTLGFWLLFIVSFAGLYYLLDIINHPVFNVTDWSDYLYFSFTNAMTPGYGGMTPYTGLGKYLACLEAIFGAFTWGCFIAIFARKYMDK